MSNRVYRRMDSENEQIMSVLSSYYTKSIVVVVIADLHGIYYSRLRYV